MTTSEVNTRHGRMKVFNEDPWVGRSLTLLGEYSESELDYMKMFIELISAKEGPIEMVEAGAYIGDMTIPLSRLVKKLYAFEPQKEVREVLLQNLEMNGIENVEVFPYALSSEPRKFYYGSEPPEAGAGGQMMKTEEDVNEVEAITLDSLNLSPGFIKADIEGMEIPFLAGAVDTLRRTRCPLFMEFDTVILEGHPPLADVLAQMGYDVYKFFFPMYLRKNFNNNPNNPFGLTVSKMLLGAPPPFSIPV